MLAVYNTINNTIVRTEKPEEKGSWINLINPTEEEITLITKAIGIEDYFIKDVLDDEERPRIETENNQILVIINVPIIQDATVIYETIPLGIILTENHLVTVCLQEVDVLKDFANGKVRGMETHKKTRFLFQILYKSASLYLTLLREIEKKTNEIELALHKSMKNKELIRLLNLQKSLVYFTTSLKSNEKVMDKMLRTKVLKVYEEDQDLLEDVIIENKQAVEMAETYSNISSSMMDAFASIISNNLNMVMKFLASITIILALPTMLASFFGMNVKIPFQTSDYGFGIVVGMSVVLCFGGVIFLMKKDMF
ncbi:magnesium transporter CorA family protein [Desulfosporosinus sp. BICA1-9]|uniref:magnesium transporter CorA family protein n=1 Tax=Desulfosporosinus sp. BICA1-9 TaxID=1531958 RepID=UPI00054C0F23|nr:magnesium transporter CorA family protein [Desulfosporosinus sp. BICA1-9]KJS90661.1 MAG: magnesium transporter [Desulfosporosinus sp. BICA1-9]HBW37229.1 magnesium transporter CorA family protein [Desulfosporosinus sp.]